MKRKRNGNRFTGSLAPVATIRQLYVDGLSTRQIAEATGYSHGWIHKICRDISRDRHEALLLRVPPPKETKHWRTNRTRARQVMEQHLERKLDSLEYVHHIDEDFTNNSIDNLEVLTPREHSRRHNPGWEIPKHKRPKTVVYMQNYNKTKRKVASCCPNCGGSFMRDKYASPDSCCSLSCGQLYRHKKHVV